MSGLRCRVLGPLELEVDGKLIELGGRKARALFAILLIDRGRVISRDHLIDQLWGDDPPASARHLVHVYISNIRRALSRADSVADTVVTHDAGYELLLEAEALDAARFERLVKESSRMLAGHDPNRAAAALDEALGLWRGPALADFAYEPFAQPEIARLEELRLVATEELADAEIALGRHQELVASLRARIGEHPVRERLYGQLMLALYRSGRQAEALASYRDARETLVSSLGVEPGPTLRDLHRAILNHDPMLAFEPAVAAEVQMARPPASRRLVTVAAVRAGSMRRDELDPEAGRAVLDSTLGVARLTFERLGASLQPSSPDALVAVFGVPEMHEDDALRAVAAAADVTAALVTRDNPNSAPCVGIESGEVVAGAAGIHGGAVPRATRLSESAAPGETLIGETAFRLVRHAVISEEAGDGPRRLIALLPDAPAFERRWDVPLVGRYGQLALLSEMFAEVVSSRRPRLVTVVGEAGIGKSRLARELVASLAPDVPSLTGRCVSHGQDVALRPFREMVETAAGAVNTNAIAALLGDSKDARHDAALIAGTLTSGEAPAGRDELFLAIRRFIDAAVSGGPAVLVFDDIHWAQQVCLDLIALMTARGRRVPLLVLCLARPDFADDHADWLVATGSERLTLESLSANESETLVAELQGARRLPTGIVARIVEAGDGNPFFLEQLFAMMTDSRRGQGEVMLPLTVRGLLSARLDRLGPGERAVLERGSVVGKEFRVELVRALLPRQAQPQVGEHLRRLQHMALLRDAPTSPAAAGVPLPARSHSRGCVRHDAEGAAGRASRTRRGSADRDRGRVGWRR